MPKLEVREANHLTKPYGWSLLRRGLGLIGGSLSPIAAFKRNNVTCIYSVFLRSKAMNSVERVS